MYTPLTAGYFPVAVPPTIPFASYLWHYWTVLLHLWSILHATQVRTTGPPQKDRVWNVTDATVGGFLARPGQLQPLPNLRYFLFHFHATPGHARYWGRPTADLPRGRGAAFICAFPANLCHSIAPPRVCCVVEVNGEAQCCHSALVHKDTCSLINIPVSFVYHSG